MIAITTATVDAIVRSFDSDIKKYSLKINRNLKALLKKPSINGVKKAYVNKLIGLSDDIIAMSPLLLKRNKRQFDSIISGTTMAEKHKGFKDEILKALGYSERRSDFYPRYFQKIGIKACVYCNSQLTISVDSEDAKNSKRKIVKAKFQVDHYLPKSEYPCFCISLFNLYPVCAYCNNAKSDKNIEWHLYSVLKQNSSQFMFELEKLSKANYMVSRNVDDIKFKFKEPHTPRGKRSFQKTFDIQGIYDTQKDIVEELIWKAEVYTDAYKKVLRSTFPKIFTSTDILNRFISGNYTDVDDMHKRPMSKFTIDMAKQIGLVK